MTSRATSEWMVRDAQADMRRAYFSGAPGIVVSGCVRLGRTGSHAAGNPLGGLAATVFAQARHDGPVQAG